MEHKITSDPINHYAEIYSSPETAVLEALNHETHASVHGAQMLSGHLQGQFLSMISHMIRPGLILELGTYTGYSAICLAAGLKGDGVLHTVDVDDKLQEMRDRYWSQAGLSAKIKQHIGDAASVIPVIEGTFDLVFIDADKKNYGLYFDLVIDRLSPHGCIVADNVLFHGEVILPPEQQSKNAACIHEFNKKIAADDRVEQVVLPVRDGVSIIRKK